MKFVVDMTMCTGDVLQKSVTASCFTTACSLALNSLDREESSYVLEEVVKVEAAIGVPPAKQIQSALNNCDPERPVRVTVGDLEYYISSILQDKDGIILTVEEVE